MSLRGVQARGLARGQLLAMNDNAITSVCGRTPEVTGKSTATSSRTRSTKFVSASLSSGGDMYSATRKLIGEHRRKLLGNYH